MTGTILGNKIGSATDRVKECPKESSEAPLLGLISRLTLRTCFPFYWKCFIDTRIVILSHYHSILAMLLQGDEIHWVSSRLSVWWVALQ